MSHAWYVIEPKAPLVFRSGKPFEAGSRDGANFPWPSSLAGLLRTQVMDAQGLDPKGNAAHLQQLLALEAAGPFLAECNPHGALEDVWFPKPVDAVLLLNEGNNTLDYKRLAPGQYADGAGSDLPDGLAPVTFSEKTKGKPQPGPQWWPLKALLRWMQGKPVAPSDIRDGNAPPPWQVERRTHVVIDRKTMAAKTGGLFQTEGLDFDATRHRNGWHDRRFVMLARGPAGITEGAVTFGGERRLSWLAPHHPPVAEPPGDWANRLRQGFALTLATPALFSDGWKPGWLDERFVGEVPGIPDLRVRLRAAALDRWQGISGWDLVKQQPRASRKAVAAGATYWFEVLEGSDVQLAQLWLAAISDAEQDRRDGFGIALSRPWHSPISGDQPA